MGSASCYKFVEWAHWSVTDRIINRRQRSKRLRLGCLFIYLTIQNRSPSSLSSLHGNKPTFSLNINNLSLRVWIDELLKFYPSLFLT